MHTYRLQERHLLSTTKKNRHYKSMRESNLHAVYKAITGTLQDSEEVVISWIGDNVVD